MTELERLKRDLNIKLDLAKDNIFHAMEHLRGIEGLVKNLDAAISASQPQGSKTLPKTVAAKVVKR